MFIVFSLKFSQKRQSVKTNIHVYLKERNELNLDKYVKNLEWPSNFVFDKDENSIYFHEAYQFRQYNNNEYFLSRAHKSHLNFVLGKSYIGLVYHRLK